MNMVLENAKKNNNDNTNNSYFISSFFSNKSKCVKCNYK